ncbi:NAD(P)-binding protein [Hypoxylon trugodes]|uniref:NAD(P)-binding protein n=1 Tax=Hypoxylon trugodes TaxID=326681 RepID=UPI002196B686|nr:NAD(P)-binding protein [Hypoxylon trugodes]KAI1388372.1 NAD(P)-binding protein [Hypoxylon trugodes]
MATLAKTVVATGATSGIGFELVKQLLTQTQPYKFILAARDAKTAQAAFDSLKYDTSKHSLTIIPSDLTNLKTVKTFSQQALEKIGQDKIDYLMLNAATVKTVDEPGVSKWCGTYIVNHLSQHYLVHLLREKLEASQSRLVFVSSGGIRLIDDPSVLDESVKRNSGTKRDLYPDTKFIALLGAHWWRRQLQGKCKVVAVSPGLIPTTGLYRQTDIKLPADHPDAKSVPVGAQSVLAAFTRDDFPEDPDRIFLTSWGEWWESDVIKLTLDKKLQDKWCPSKDEVEKEEGITA